jgi:FkbM family methyltransferase
MQRASIDLNAGGQSRRFHYRPGASDERVIAEVLKNREYDFARLRRGPELNDLYQRMVEAGKTPLIIDAGANIGASAIWFAYTFPAAQVVAIEPEAENFALLEANTPGARIEPLRAALAARPGRLRLFDPGEGAWGFRTAPPTPDAADAGAVEAVALNDLYAARADTCVPFIAKIDIEGGETDVFSAATEWVAQTPVVIIELHDWLLTGQASARPFLACVSALDRDFVYVGENVFSIDNQLGRFAP